MTSEPTSAPWRAPKRPCVIVLIGAAGAGKSTWAQAQPGLTPISSDALREQLTDDASHQGCTQEVFALMGSLAALRLGYGRPALLDATHTRAQSRAPWLKLARAHGVPAIAVWFDVDQARCEANQTQRARRVPSAAIARQREAMAALPEALLQEPWDEIVRLRPDDQGGLTSQVLRAWQRPLTSPVTAHGAMLWAPRFDVVGDVHGCLEELVALMGSLGWQRDDAGQWHHPQARVLVFAGDLVDRGPDSPGVLALVSQLIDAGQAVMVPGNHDDKLARHLRGNKVTLTHGLEATVAQLDAMAPEPRAALIARALPMLERAPLWLLAAPTDAPDAPFGAQLVIAHAAWKPSMIGRKRSDVRWFCLYGPSTGQQTAHGLPERLDWRARYPAHAPRCLHGHTPYDGPVRWQGRTLCLDTGCVFGGHLSAWRWPEQTLVQQPAAKVYFAHEPPLEQAPSYASAPAQDVGES